MHRKKYQELIDDRQYQFDAFVSYSAVDSEWVKCHLPLLETTNNLRLCFYDRDWLPGRDITDNIVDSMENSRKTILIVSNAYAMTQWCHFELALVQTRMLESDLNNLILDFGRNR